MISEDERWKRLVVTERWRSEGQRGGSGVEVNTDRRRSTHLSL